MKFYDFRFSFLYIHTKNDISSYRKLFKILYYYAKKKIEHDGFAWIQQY